MEWQTEPWRLVLEASPAGLLMIDALGRIVLVNAQVERIFGRSRSELIGQPVECLLPERLRGAHAGLRAGFFGALQARPMGAGRDLVGLRKDGTELPVEIGLNPITTAEGSFVLGSIVDITERKRAEAELRLRTEELARSNAEKETLLQEMHHRVKNNLQVISSMLGLQQRSAGDPRLTRLLEECRQRVLAIALVHEQLFLSGDLAATDLSDTTRSLVQSLMLSHGPAGRGITLVARIDPCPVANDDAVPLGLVLNELLSNALEHAFPAGRAGTICVSLGRGAAGRLELSVADDGVGLPAGIEPREARTLGLQLVHTLCAQLRADLTITRGPGTTFRLLLREAP